LKIFSGDFQGIYIHHYKVKNLNKNKMEKVSMKIVMAAIIIVAGTLGLQAQNGKGTGTCGSCPGTCISICPTSCTSTCFLTDDQKAILDELYITFQYEMDVLRTELITATTFADKLIIRQELDALKDAHLLEVRTLLAEWGISV
jgi:hypothetical protein